MGLHENPIFRFGPYSADFPNPPCPLWLISSRILEVISPYIHAIDQLRWTREKGDADEVDSQITNKDTFSSIAPFHQLALNTVLLNNDLLRNDLSSAVWTKTIVDRWLTCISYRLTDLPILSGHYHQYPPESRAYGPEPDQTSPSILLPESTPGSDSDELGVGKDLVLLDPGVIGSCLKFDTGYQSPFIWTTKDDDAYAWSRLSLRWVLLLDLALGLTSEACRVFCVFKTRVGGFVLAISYLLPVCPACILWEGVSSKKVVSPKVIYL